MTKRINVIGKAAERIVDTGPTHRRIEPAEVAAALGGELVEHVEGDLDLISLAEIGASLLKRLRSTGGRPALEDATEICRVPFTKQDVAALEQIVAAIHKTTGAKPSIGQIASVIVRTHIEALTEQTNPVSKDKALTVAQVKSLLEEELRPIREELARVAGQYQAG